jgi:kynurenine formamidase
MTSCLKRIWSFAVHHGMMPSVTEGGIMSSAAAPALALSIASLLPGCWRSAAPTSARADAIALAPGARIIDLTHSFDDKTPYWPVPHQTFALTRIFCDTMEGTFICMNKMSAPEHGGTHIDAPIHFAKGHATVDQIPVSRLVGPAVVIDMSAAAQAKVDVQLTAVDVAAFESAHGSIERGSIVLVRTNWADRWPDRKSYFGDDKLGDDTHLHFPGIGVDAAKVFIERGVAAVGIDGPSIDYGPSQDFAVHKLLLGSDTPQFENVASIKELPAKGALVIALPMKIGGGTGAPLRIIAILPPQS